VQDLLREAHILNNRADQLLEEVEQAVETQNPIAAELAQRELVMMQRQAKNMVDWALKSQSRSRLESLLALAKSEPELAAHVGDFDQSPWLLNVLNGTLDLRTGKLRPHDPADMLTKLVQANYNSEAQCPTWLTFLERVQPDPAVRTFLQRSIGYSLTGLVGEQVFWFLYGTGANGKSVFSNTIVTLLGDYAMKVRAETLMRKSGDSIPEEVAAMAGRRFALASELGEGQHLNESLIKDLTGGDRMRARFLHRNSFEYDPQAKIWMFGNHKPLVTGTDVGIWRRPRLVPFTVIIPENERDPELFGKLLSELDGILTWAVQACRDWQAYGLAAPDAVAAATQEFRTENDLVGRFLAECTEPGGTTTAHALYQVYRAWSESEGHKPMSSTALGRRLSERGVPRARTMHGFYYHGIALNRSESNFC
jgi:putative DNA primase/helicase